MREDFIRERAEYRESLAGMREAMQAADADCRQAARERDEALASATAAQAAAKPGPSGRGSRKRSQRIEVRAAGPVAERHGDRSTASRSQRPCRGPVSTRVPPGPRCGRRLAARGGAS